MPASYKLFEVNVVDYSDTRVQELMSKLWSDNTFAWWMDDFGKIHERKLIDENNVFLAFQVECSGSTYKENGFHVGAFGKLKGVPDGLLSRLAKEGKVSVKYLTTVY